MTRWFNIAGPCKDDIHYMLSPTVRLPDLEELIQQRSYFVLHAPRQTGKTTAMLALAQQLTDRGNYAAVMVSVEVGSPFNHDPTAAELAILGTWYNTIQVLDAPNPEEDAIREELQSMSQQAHQQDMFVINVEDAFPMTVASHTHYSWHYKKKMNFAIPRCNWLRETTSDQSIKAFYNTEHSHLNVFI